MGFPRQESQRGLPFPPPGDLPDPGVKPQSFASPSLAGRFFTPGATWEAQHRCIVSQLGRLERAFTELGSRCWQACLPSGGSRGEFIFLPLPTFRSCFLGLCPRPQLQSSSVLPSNLSLSLSLEEISYWDIPWARTDSLSPKCPVSLTLWLEVQSTCQPTGTALGHGGLGSLTSLDGVGGAFPELQFC